MSPLPPRRTSLNQANPDWSEKTASLWSDHTNFLEQTKVSGIAPPVRGGTITGLIAAEKQRSKKSRRWATLGMILIIPLTAGGVFFYLANQQETASTEEASIEEPVVTVAKNPNKNKNKNKNVAAGSLAQVAAGTIKEESSDPSIVKHAPFSLGATDSTHRPPNEKFLKPVVDLSKTPPAQGDWAATPRSQPALYLTRDEVGFLTKVMARDPVARAIAEKWKTTARSAVGIGINPVAQFRFGTEEERKASQTAREDVKTLTTMLYSLLAWGEQDLMDQMKSQILAWSQTYKPLGDVYSDAEIVPVIVAYGNIYYRFTPEETKQVDAWLKLMADRQITEAIQRSKRDDRWFAYHLHFVTHAGFATATAHLQNYVKREFPVHLANALLMDGSTVTLAQTGSMSLHLDHMNKLLETTLVHYRIGRIIPEIVPISTNTYGRAVQFTAPYATGMRGWTEFEKAADPTIAKRQAAGDISVATRAFDWRSDVTFLETLAYFRLPPRIADVSIALSTIQTPYPTSRTLIIESMIRDTKWVFPPPAGPMPASAK